VAVEPAVIRYVRQVVAATRQSPVISLGGGPRASICLLLASKAAALLRGRSFATPDDVKAMSGPVLRHRIALAPDAELEGLTPDRAVRQVLDRVEVPR
jgi:MoxR-like ATPase